MDSLVMKTTAVEKIDLNWQEFKARLTALETKLKFNELLARTPTDSYRLPKTKPGFPTNFVSDMFTDLELSHTLPDTFDDDNKSTPVAHPLAWQELSDMTSVSQSTHKREDSFSP